MHLDLDRCTIRSWHPHDAERLAAIANDRELWRMVRDRFPHPYTLADARAFIARVRAEVPERNFAIAVDGVAMGGIGFTPGEDIHRVSAEVGYWLGRAARGRGLATEALRALVAWIWANTDVHHLYATVFTYNPESARVLERAGFDQAALARHASIKEGVLHDEWRYHLSKPHPPSARLPVF